MLGSMSRAVGIDLGTTNSCVAVVEKGKPVVIPNSSGYRVTPSIYAVTKDGKKLVGHLAKRQAVMNPENTVFAFKRLIGRRFESLQVQESIRRYPYKIVKGHNDDVRVKLVDREYTVPEISAMILTELKFMAAEFLGGEVEKAVITVPHILMIVKDRQRRMLEK